VISVATLVAEGFAMAVVVTVFVWGMSIPVRLLFRFLGIGA